MRNGCVPKALDSQKQAEVLQGSAYFPTTHLLSQWQSDTFTISSRSHAGLTKLLYHLESRLCRTMRKNKKMVRSLPSRTLQSNQRGPPESNPWKAIMKEAGTWKAGSVFKSIDFSYWGPKFRSHHPYQAGHSHLYLQIQWWDSNTLYWPLQAPELMYTMRLIHKQSLNIYM